MGNLLTTKIPLESRGRAPMLRSIFQTRQLKAGMEQLSCDVVFGSPSADCSGTGVCKISAYAAVNQFDKKKDNCRHAPGILIPLEGGEGVSLVFAREMLCIKLFRSQFRNGIFTVNESCTLPQDIVAALSLKINRLKPGNYKVEEAGGFFRVNFY